MSTLAEPAKRFHPDATISLSRRHPDANNAPISALSKETKAGRMLNLALKMATRSNFHTYKMSCILVQSNRIVNIGLNSLSPGILKHPSYINGKSKHAEIDAVLNIDPKILRNSTLYVAGLSRGKNLCCSKPCEICQQVLKEYGIKKVVYHTETGEVCSVKL